MKHWIGKSLVLIGLIHTLFWLILIVPQMAELFHEGDLVIGFDAAHQSPFGDSDGL